MGEALRERGIQKGKDPMEKNNPQQDISQKLKVKRTKRNKERKKVVKRREKTWQKYGHASINHLFPPS